MKTDTLAPELAVVFRNVFGSASEPMTVIEQRAREALAGKRAIVWEGDAATFHFSFVGQAAEEILGYPRNRWIDEPTFWADRVVHPDDRDEAIAFCALATGKCQDHDFIYRARRADGGVVWHHDVVQVIRGTRGIPERLRGVMVDVSDQMQDAPATHAAR